MTIDLDQLVLDCRDALHDAAPRRAVREVLERLVHRPDDLVAALPAPRQQMTVVHVSDDLTIFQLVNGPGYQFHPHDHGCWSAVAFYAGRERNTFYRRTSTGLTPSGGRDYDAGEVAVLGRDVVHAIENPLGSNNAALHVFAGKPFTAACSQWDPTTLAEAPFDAGFARAAYPPAALINA